MKVVGVNTGSRRKDNLNFSWIGTLAVTVSLYQTIFNVSLSLLGIFYMKDNGGKLRAHPRKFHISIRTCPHRLRVGVFLNIHRVHDGVIAKRTMRSFPRTTTSY